MTKIDIVSGFLGAGKTTLIRKLIEETLKGQKIVLIENEFGEIGIDGGFLQDAGIDIKEMNSGCICCSLVGDFGQALGEVFDRFTPDRIIIEPSGVGKLSDVIKAVLNATKDKDVELATYTAVADASKCLMYMKNFGEFYNNQIESAKTIVLSRTQNLTEEKLAKAVALLREKNAEATIVTTPWDDLTGDQLLSAMEEKSDFEAKLLAEIEAMEEEHHHHHHDDDEDEHEHHHHHHDDDDDDDDEDEHEHEHHHHEHHHEHGHEHHHHHHHHGADEHDADEVFGTIGLETAQRYEIDEIRAILAKLSDEEEYGRVLRSKGILQNAAGSWFQFDYVPGEIVIRDGSADYTGRLCVIGADLDEKALTELFQL